MSLEGFLRHFSAIFLATTSLLLCLQANIILVVKSNLVMCLVYDYHVPLLFVLKFLIHLTLKHNQYQTKQIINLVYFFISNL